MLGFAALSQVALSALPDAGTPPVTVVPLAVTQVTFGAPFSSGGVS